MSRLIDFTFSADLLGKETIDFLITPDVTNTLDGLKDLAKRVSFQELNSLYDFYSNNRDAIIKAPPTIKGLFAALKGGNAMAVVAYVGLLLAIMQAAGIIGSNSPSVEEIVEIVREYDATHPDPIQQTHIAPDHDIAPEMVDPPESLDS